MIWSTFWISPGHSWWISIKPKIWIWHFLSWVISAGIIIIQNKSKTTISAWILGILQLPKDNSVRTFIQAAINLQINITKEEFKDLTFISSMCSTPGPTSSMIFRNSSSVQIFGTLPMNNLCFVSESEHLKVLPCRDETHYRSQSGWTYFKSEQRQYYLELQKRNITTLNVLLCNSSMAFCATSLVLNPINA